MYWPHVAHDRHPFAPEHGTTRLTVEDRHAFFGAARDEEVNEDLVSLFEVHAAALSHVITDDAWPCPKADDITGKITIE